MVQGESPRVRVYNGEVYAWDGKTRARGAREGGQADGIRPSGVSLGDGIWVSATEETWADVRAYMF